MIKSAVYWAITVVYLFIWAICCYHGDWMSTLSCQLMGWDSYGCAFLGYHGDCATHSLKVCLGDTDLKEQRTLSKLFYLHTATGQSLSEIKHCLYKPASDLQLLPQTNICKKTKKRKKRKNNLKWISVKVHFIQNKTKKLRFLLPGSMLKF